MAAKPFTRTRLVSVVIFLGLVQLYFFSNAALSDSFRRRWTDQPLSSIPVMPSLAIAKLASRSDKFSAQDPVSDDLAEAEPLAWAGWVRKLQALEPQLNPRTDGPELAKAVHIDKAIGSTRITKEAMSELNFTVDTSPTLRGSGRVAHWDAIVCYARWKDACLGDREMRKLEQQRDRFAAVNVVAKLREVIWDKDSFCKTTQAAGVWASEFTLPCWVLPGDLAAIRAVALDEPVPGARRQWIVKPLQAGGGNGISVVDGAGEMLRLLDSGRAQKPLVVQPYIANPGLLLGRKWDMRVFVLMTGVTPVARAFMFDQGIVRLAADQYDAQAAHGGARRQFLTNTHVSGHGGPRSALSEKTWSYARLAAALGTEKYELLMQRVRRALGMLLVLAERRFAQQYARIAPGFRCVKCHALMGVDVMADADLRPTIIEVNGNPSLVLIRNASAHYDITKTTAQQELARIVFAHVADLPDTAASAIEAAGLSAEDAAVLAKDAEMQAYVLRLVRELSLAKGFRPVYPNEELCGDAERAEFWAGFVAQAGSQGAERDAQRRLAMHRIASAVLCKTHYI